MGDPAFIANQIFNGFSVASLFVLAALGLALSFGLMRVMNMAHGEMLMLGGYLAYLTLMIAPGPFAILIALPIAFIGAALMGGIIENAVIRRLATRPLDTLLATWGVSLILQQGARDVFGAIGVGVTAPDWLNHSLLISSGPLAGLNLPATRIFILFIAVLVLAATAFLINRTRMGLLVRAVNQDRFMAAASGINVRRVDLMAFCLGSGVAGVAGVVLALLGPVTPNVGQTYIIPAFLVVILGGLGSIVGTVAASAMIGLISALSQLFLDVSAAQVVVLLFVILFLQIRPQGVVAVRSRALD